MLTNLIPSPTLARRASVLAAPAGCNFARVGRGPGYGDGWSGRPSGHQAAQPTAAPAA
jgi:hypothetical protein